MKDIISDFLILHPVGVSHLFDEDQLIFISARHVVIQVAEKLGRVSVGEVVIGSYEQCPGVSNLFRLGEVTVLRRVYIAKQS